MIAQQANAPRPRDKNKPQDANGARRPSVRDEVRLSDPIAAQAIDSKPDAADEWKHKRKDRPDSGSGGTLDIKA